MDSRWFVCQLCRSKDAAAECIAGHIVHHRALNWSEHTHKHTMRNSENKTTWRSWHKWCAHRMQVHIKNGLFCCLIASNLACLASHGFCPPRSPQRRRKWVECYVWYVYIYVARAMMWWIGYKRRRKRLTMTLLAVIPCNCLAQNIILNTKRWLINTLPSASRIHGSIPPIWHRGVIVSDVGIQIHSPTFSPYKYNFGQTPLIVLCRAERFT